MRIVVLLWALLLGLPQLAGAADGAPCNDVDTYRQGTCVQLCDAKTGTGACNGGLGLRVSRNYYGGAFTVEISKATGCTACTVTVEWASSAVGLVRHSLATLTCTGGASAHTELRGMHFPGYVFANVTAQTACTNLDVVGHFE